MNVTYDCSVHEQIKHQVRFRCDSKQSRSNMSVQFLNGLSCHILVHSVFCMTVLLFSSPRYLFVFSCFCIALERVCFFPLFAFRRWVSSRQTGHFSILFFCSRPSRDVFSCFFVFRLLRRSFLVFFSLIVREDYRVQDSGRPEDHHQPLHGVRAIRYEERS